MKKIIFRMPQDLIDELDRKAEAEDISRSEALRRSASAYANDPTLDQKMSGLSEGVQELADHVEAVSDVVKENRAQFRGLMKLLKDEGVIDEDVVGFGYP